MKSIFISSTFRDMQFERDALQDKVLPSLNEKARKYGQSVSFCDLRWGVDTSQMEEESGSIKVLDVCLDEIDRSNPPMIVIIGERYGWIPPETLVSDLATRKKLELEHLRKSITSLEIEYGALSRNDGAQNALFYFREFDKNMPAEYDTEDEEHKILLDDLKEKIRNLTNGRIKSYHVYWDGNTLQGMDEFAEIVKNDLLEIMQPSWEKYNNMTPFEKEIHTHRSFIREKAAMFSARKNLADRFLKMIEDGRNCFIAKGGVGTGKSTLFSYMALELEKRGYKVIPYISCLTNLSNTATEILNGFITTLENLLQLENDELMPVSVDTLENSKPGSIKELRERLDFLCRECKIRKIKIALMLDAANQLFADDALENLVFIPDALSDYVKFIMTATDDFSVGGRDFVTVTQIEQNEKTEVIKGILASKNRELGDDVIKAMISKSGSNTPLYFSFMIQRLILMNRQEFDEIVKLGDGIDAIVKYQCRVIADCPDTLDEMAAELLRVAGERINKEMVDNCAVYMSLSQYGLRTEDFKGLLGDRFNMLDFSHFTVYMSDCFIMRDDGRIDFSHGVIRSGYQKLCEDKKMCHSELFKYFLSLDKTDEIRKKEIVYHAILADKIDFFKQYISEMVNLDDTSYITAAAINTYKVCCEDNGEWVKSVLNTLEQNECSIDVLSFFNYDFYSAFGDSDADKELLAMLCDDILHTARRILVNLDAEKAKRTLRGSLVNSGNILYKKREYHGAFEMYCEACKLMKDVVDKNPSDRNLKILAQVYAKMGNAYSHFYGETSAREEAIEIAEKAVSYLLDAISTYESTQCRESVLIKRMVARLYASISGVYSSNALYDIDKMKIKAFNYLIKAEKAAEQLCKEECSVSNINLLAYTYGQLGDVYGSFVIKDKELEYCTKTLSAYRQANEMRHTLATSNNVADAHYYLGEAYFYSKFYGEYEKARCEYEKASSIYKTLMEEINSDTSRQSYVEALCFAGKAYTKSDKETDVVKALKYFEKGEKILKEIRNPERYENFNITFFNYYGDALIKFGEKFAAENERETYFKKAKIYYDISEKLTEKLGKTEYAKACSEMMAILENTDESLADKIDSKILSLFSSIALRNHKFTVNTKLELGEQKMSNKTKNLIAMVYMNYWIDDKSERANYRKILQENQKKFDEEQALAK